jgi:hypothetical protein
VTGAGEGGVIDHGGLTVAGLFAGVGGIELDDAGTRRLAEALAEGVAEGRRAYVWVEKKDSNVHVQLLG